MCACAVLMHFDFGLTKIYSRFDALIYEIVLSFTQIPVHVSGALDLLGPNQRCKYDLLINDLGFSGSFSVIQRDDLNYSSRTYLLLTAKRMDCMVN